MPNELISVNVYYTPPIETQNAIRAAAGLWTDAPPTNSEYWRGQVELICDLAAWPGVDSDSKREAVESVLRYEILNRQKEARANG